MFRHVPNLLTGGRLVLAAVFFVMLGFYQYEGRGDTTLLNAAFLVYLVALITDFLDGYLARRWKVEGAFGRVVDPFVDKVLVLGSFIFFAGKNFIIPDTVPSTFPAPFYVVKTITGIAPWVVVILLSRELLVTSLRALAESAGEKFGAAYIGKVKMATQSGTILVILVYVNYLAAFRANGIEVYARWVRDICICLTVVVTVYSGLQYVRKIASAYRRGAMLASDPFAKPALEPPRASSVAAKANDSAAA